MRFEFSAMRGTARAEGGLILPTGTLHVLLLPSYLASMESSLFWRLKECNNANRASWKYVMKFIIMQLRRCYGGVGLLADQGKLPGHPAVTGTKSDCEAPSVAITGQSNKSWPPPPSCWPRSPTPTTISTCSRRTCWRRTFLKSFF